MEAVVGEINGWYTLQQTENVQRSTPNVQRPTEDGIVFGLDREGNLHHGPQVEGFSKLKADGSTACGGWIYSGVLGPDKINKANSRDSKNYLGNGWDIVWPADRSIICNRASAEPTGEPCSFTSRRSRSRSSKKSTRAGTT
jgi:hypothetical protein